MGRHVPQTAYSLRQCHLLISPPNCTQELAAKYKKTVAQVALKWAVQRGTVVIPKSNRPERLEENIKLFDFEIEDADMKRISSLDRKARSNNPAPFWGIDLYA